MILVNFIVFFFSSYLEFINLSYVFIFLRLIMYTLFDTNSITFYNMLRLKELKFIPIPIRLS
ncbi:hypothetical protein C2G38_338175 [Gigaspora rosea]|uniref:Uncharacterized protein n=1 Tax=Gigaspora rosea TaxID=44941 RepID=A0A397UE38_9GLOM|nr:hypothetical protein C2G38_338175 [Gigaspora rosea]